MEESNPNSVQENEELGELGTAITYFVCFAALATLFTCLSVFKGGMPVGESLLVSIFGAFACMLLLGLTLSATKPSNTNGRQERK